MRGSDYAELRAFVAVAQHASFTRAAAHLGMSASALSQTIRSLEERLGVRLLHRTTRSVAPSEAGQRLLERLIPTMSDLDGAVADIAEAAGVLAGRLRINSNRLAAIHCLAPLIRAFTDAYPAVSLDIVVDDALVDIVTSGFDAGVRLGEKLEKDMIAVKLGGEVRMMVVAAPEYCARFGKPSSPRDLARHRCLNTRWPTDGSPYRWEFQRGTEVLEVAVEGPLISNEPEVIVRAACDGAGIAYLFEHQLRDCLASGALVHLLPDWSPAFPGFYLYYPSRRHLAAPLRAFLDLVAAQAARA